MGGGKVRELAEAGEPRVDGAGEGAELGLEALAGVEGGDFGVVEEGVPGGWGDWGGRVG